MVQHKSMAVNPNLSEYEQWSEQSERDREVYEHERWSFATTEGVRMVASLVVRLSRGTKGAAAVMNEGTRTDSERTNRDKRLSHVGFEFSLKHL